MIANNSDSAGFHGGGLSFFGKAEVRESIVTGNTSLLGGGGIYAWGDLLVTASTVSENSGGNEGGGILVKSGNAVISDSTISGNVTSHFGGGIWSQAPITIRNSLVTSNSTRVGGGGLSLDHDAIIITSTITNNSSGGGGGVYSRGPLLLKNSVVSNNVARFEGGGMYSRIGQQSTLIVSGSTISGNSAMNDGGGIATRVGNTASFFIKHSTITNNIADSDDQGFGSGGGIFVSKGSVSLVHSIVAGNIDNSGTAPNLSGIFNSTYSLVGQGAEFLGPLQDNGGPTPTHALLPGSPAIDAGNPNLMQGDAGLPEFDQRGAPFARVAGSRIDIGAFEFQSPSGDLSADFDRDGDTDGFDFLTWQRGFAIAIGADPSVGDSTFNGTVDVNDLAVWEQKYGESLARASSSPPIDLALSANVLDIAERPVRARYVPLRRNDWVEADAHREQRATPTRKSSRLATSDDASDSLENQRQDSASDVDAFDLALDEVFAGYGG